MEWGYLTGKAQRLRDEDVFYQYVDLDYRGRVYYIESFMNFQGSDWARGIMEFAHAKPMTAAGQRWLAIHTACCYNESYNIDEIPEWCTSDYVSYLQSEGLDSISVDKMTLEDRYQWTLQSLSDIIEWAKSDAMVLSAEKPVSFLACCYEWLDYTDAMLAKRMHMTRLPIPIDGSNNGWQHLGAMSKDTQTGELVGLVPVEIQKDFYVQTAKKMLEMVKDEELQAILSSMPMKDIRKGISKRGSMTRAYSAGVKKISENMWMDCKGEDYHEKYGLTEEHCLKLAKVLVKAIDEVCPGPLQTMEYLQELVKFCLGSFEFVDSEGNPVKQKDLKELRARRKELSLVPSRTDEEDEELNDLVKKLDSFEYKLISGLGETSVTWSTPSGFTVVYESWRTQRAAYRGTISGYTKYSQTRTS